MNEDIVDELLGQCTGTVEIGHEVVVEWPEVNWPDQVSPSGRADDLENRDHGYFVFLGGPPVSELWYYGMKGFTKDGICHATPAIGDPEPCDVLEMITKFADLTDEFVQGNVTALDFPMKAKEITSPCVEGG